MLEGNFFGHEISLRFLFSLAFFCLGGLGLVGLRFFVKLGHQA